jgi:hypothetical protein
LTHADDSLESSLIVIVALAIVTWLAVSFHVVLVDAGAAARTTCLATR